MLLRPALAVLPLAACTSQPSTPAPRLRTFEPGLLFPPDATLDRAEDGVALPDGSLLVSDRSRGLRLVLPDGTSRPFGDLPGAGYANDPPRRGSTANGVRLEPGGTHVLVADVVGGEIYRVALASGATEVVYRHPFGVNCAVRDSSGAIWFSQSAENTEEMGELGMFTPVDVPTRQGALHRLPFEGARFASRAQCMVAGLQYANGIALDERRGRLYLSELAANRVLSYPLDVAAGTLGPATTLVELPTPDNLELDAEDRLWIVSPASSAVHVLELGSGRHHTVFQQQSPEQARLSREFLRRGERGEPRLELLTPALFEPLPGFLTGVIHAPDGTVYVSNLGNALIRLAPSDDG